MSQSPSGSRFYRVRRALTMPSSSHQHPPSTSSSTSTSTSSSTHSSSQNLSKLSSYSNNKQPISPTTSRRSSQSLQRLSLTKITSLKIQSALPPIMLSKGARRQRKVEDWRKADMWEWEHPSSEVLEKRSRKWNPKTRESLRGWNGFEMDLGGEGDERSIYEGISPCTTRCDGSSAYSEK